MLRLTVMLDCCFSRHSRAGSHLDVDEVAMVNIRIKERIETSLSLLACKFRDDDVETSALFLFDYLVMEEEVETAFHLPKET